MEEMVSHAILNLVHMAALLIVIVNCVVHLNQMGTKTRHVIRMAYIALAAGSATALCAIAVTSQPDAAHMMVSLSLAFYMVVSRRLRTRIRFTDRQHIGGRQNG